MESDGFWILDLRLWIDDARLNRELAVRCGSRCSARVSDPAARPDRRAPREYWDRASCIEYQVPGTEYLAPSPTSSDRQSTRCQPRGSRAIWETFGHVPWLGRRPATT